MEKRRRTRRRRRRSRSLLEYLLPMTAVMLVGVLLAAALGPGTAAKAGTVPDTHVEQLADQLAGNVAAEPPQNSSLPAPAQKGTIPSRVLNPES